MACFSYALSNLLIVELGNLDKTKQETGVNKTSLLSSSGVFVHNQDKDTTTHETHSIDKQVIITANLFFAHRVDEHYYTHHFEKLGRQLFEACEIGDENLVRRLLSEGADVLYEDEDGWTPGSHLKNVLK